MLTANLEGRGSSGKFEPHFNGENRSEREKIFGRVIYASETIQNCKNPTGHMDTLRYNVDITVHTIPWHLGVQFVQYYNPGFEIQFKKLINNL